MTAKLPYDKTDPKSIERYAKKLIGKTFQDVLNESIYSNSKVGDESGKYGDEKRKGGLGNLLEKYYFGYEVNSDSEPDFKEAGVELKVSPYEEKNKGGYKAGERLVLTMINFNKEVEQDFYKSHVWEKCKLMLLIYYFRDKAIKNNLDYHIDYAKLFEIPEKDMNIIINDYKMIIDKIMQGKAHEISEGDTMYLGACTKGATAAKSLVSQRYNENVKAKSRAFCLKNSYMTTVLNNYLMADECTDAAEFASEKELEAKSISEIIQDRLNKYINWNEDRIASKLGIDINKKNKSYEAIIVKHMLGVNELEDEKIDEFQKAGINVKVVKFKKHGKPNENMRLEDINFINLDKEPFDDEIKDEEGNDIGWEASRLYEILGNRKYLFAVFWEDEEGAIFKGCQLWAMPDEDLEKAKAAWKELKIKIRNGVEFEVNGNIVTNNLTKSSENGIFHVRPHAKNSFYKFTDGTEIGNGNIRDTDLLPSGDRITRQAYWLNRSYINSQLEDTLIRHH